jgi:hypothetical protein
MEWPERQESLGEWRMGAAQLFSGTWEMTIFYNGTEVKVSSFLGVTDLLLLDLPW